LSTPHCIGAVQADGRWLGAVEAPSGPPLSSGTASLAGIGHTVATVTVDAATGGTSPYSYQWYRSTSSGFTPGGGTIVSGATNRTLDDTGLTDGTLYYYKAVATDAVAATVTSNEVPAVPAPASSGPFPFWMEA
jgi:hypothetical protein